MKYKYSTITLFFFTFFWLSATCQTNNLVGLVTDAKSGDPLPFVNVSLNNGERGTTTDLKGTFGFNLPTGEYTLKFDFIGYTLQEQSVTISGKNITNMDIKLEESAEILDQVVVTTNKSGTRVGESTVSIAVISPTLVDNSNTSTVETVVEKVPGVNVIDGQANIRGGSGYSYGAGSRVLLLVDDLPYLQGDAGFPNWRDIPVENIGSIEVLKGAASALYGTAAMNGIINIRTAYPTSEPETKFAFYNTLYFPPAIQDTCETYGVGMCDTTGQGHLIDRNWWGRRAPLEAGAQFSHRQRWGKFDLVLGANLYLRESFRQDEIARRGRVTFNTRYRITERLSVGLNANINGGPTQSFFIWENPYQGAYQPFSLNGAISSTTESNSKRFNFDPFLTYFDNAGNRHKILTRYFFVNNDNNNNQGNKSNTFYGEYQYQRTFAQLGGLNVVAGFVGQTVNSDSELFGNAEFSTSNIAAYVQADRKFFDKLNVSVGLRYERNTINSPDSVANPLEPTMLLPNPETQSIEGKPVLRLGINYQPAEYTFFRASWGQGYRFPTIAERYTLADIGGVIGVRPNPVLQSETGWTGEIGVRQGFKVSNWQGFLDVSAFWSEYQDMMEFTFGGADPENQFLGFQSVNIDDTRIRGFEASIIGKGKLFGVPTEVLTGYTYIDPQYQTFSERQQELSSSDENILKYRFEHTFKLDIQSQFFGKVDVGVAVQYNSFMKAVDRFFEEVQLSPVIPPVDLFGLRDYRARNQNGTAVLNLRFAYNFNENAKLSCLVKNATNQVYMLRPALMEAPINVTIRGDFKF